MGGCFPKPRKEQRSAPRRVQISDDQQELYDLDYDDVPYFTFKGQSRTAIVCDVYDGDTCTIIFVCI